MDRACREFTTGEEIANAVSHGIAFVAAAIAGPIVIALAADDGSPAELVGVSVFVGTVLLVYLASTVYHALPVGRWKETCRTFDHVAIYLLIAGTYTPFTLGVLRGAWGWTLFGLVWSMAAAGVAATLARGPRSTWLTTGLYVAMGWVILIAAHEIWVRMPPAGLAWLVAGGVVYTAGTVFFLAQRVRYAHLVWHLFVVGGTACHFPAVVAYAGT